MKIYPLNFLLGFGLLFLFLGCSQAASPVAIVPAVDVLPTAAATLPPSPTSQPPSPIPPSATPPPSATAIPTATHTPTATPTPTHPLMIEVMRRQNYPGSEIIIEQVLDPGDNYDRYIASYLSEGNKIFALLTVPQGEPPAAGWPVVVFNHGYIPPEQYRTTERYVAYVDGFARSGYIVFRSDYRGHGSSEGEATGGYGTPDYTIDVLNAVAAVKAYPAADPNRIGMWGHSMGGHITLRSMVTTGDIRAGVIWAGVVVSYEDLFTTWRRDENGTPVPTRTPDPESTRGRWRLSIFDVYGDWEENPAFWASISPISYAADLSGPIQLHHATGDEIVPYDFSETLYAEMLAAGALGELYIYEGDNHNISVNFTTAMNRSIAFFDAHVKGE